MSNPKDTDLIEKVLSGDTGAFSGLVDRYSERVFALAFRIAGSREDAQEITQDALLKAYGHLERFRRASSFSSWLYRIAYNTAISHVRRNGHFRVAAPNAEQVPDPGTDAPPHEEQLVRLERALEQLSPDDRALVQLFYLEERPVREIAEIIGLSENNVKTRLHRIRKRLGTIYEEM